VNESVAVVILAGGQSKRMNKKNKAMVLLKDKPLIQHVIDAMKLQTPHIFISTHHNQDDFRIFNLPLIDDDAESHEGPLLGMMSSLKKIKTEWIQFVPCDTPHLPQDLIEILKKVADKNHTKIAVPETSDGLQSACILCHISSLENLNTFFNAGGRKIEDWIRQLPFSIVPFENQACFLNINTEEELKKNSL
jgi:molybdopterin-guanine dinucleotide biosynthesis protein A